MPIPVLTGIGHEIDRTIADEVAHTTCKTPTACAQVLVERVREYVDRLDALSSGVAHRARAGCAVADRELAACVRRVRLGAPRAIARELAELERRRGRAEELGSRAARTAAVTLDARRALLAAAGARLARNEDRRLDALTDRLRALDPARVLERGYSITRAGDGRVVKRAASLQAGDRIVTEFPDGRAESTVDTRELVEP